MPKPFTHFLIIFLIIPIIHRAQTIPTCASLKNITAYFYPKNSTDAYLEVIAGDRAVETMATTGDSSVWEVKWTGDCSFTQKYIGGSIAMPEGTLKFLKKNKLRYDVDNVTAEYFTFKVYVDKQKAVPIQEDTMWFKERPIKMNSVLVDRVTDPSEPQRAHFRDTSQYALLYVYRPGKFAMSGVNNPVYLDDNLICITTSNSSYIFKIKKEGMHEVKTKLFKNESVVNLNVQFGKSYYIKSMMHLRFTLSDKNFNVEVAQMDNATGAREFGGVKFKQCDCQ